METSMYVSSGIRFYVHPVLTRDTRTVPTGHHQIVSLQPHSDQDSLPIQGRCELLHRDDQQDGGQGCSLVLSQSP